MDYIPFELLKTAGEATTTVLTAICQKTWETKEWPKEWTQSLVIISSTSHLIYSLTARVVGAP